MEMAALCCSGHRMSTYMYILYRMDPKKQVPYFYSHDVTSIKSWSKNCDILIHWCNQIFSAGIMLCQQKLGWVGIMLSTMLCNDVVPNLKAWLLHARFAGDFFNNGILSNVLNYCVLVLLPSDLSLALLSRFGIICRESSQRLLSGPHCVSISCR